MSVKVFDSFDTSIRLDREVMRTTEETNFTGGEIEVNNIANTKRFPKVTITANEETVLQEDFLTNGENQVISFINNDGTKRTHTLFPGDDDDDELVLDFKKQIYEENDNSIINVIDFDDELIHLIENESNNFQFNIDGSVDIEIKNYGYENARDLTWGRSLSYVEGFDLNKNQNFSVVKPYNSNHQTDSKKISETYNFNIEKMETDWEVFDAIEQGHKYRVGYKEYVPATDEVWVKFLLGVRFTRFNRNFNMGDFILHNMSGEAEKLLSYPEEGLIEALSIMGVPEYEQEILLQEGDIKW